MCLQKFFDEIKNEKYNVAIFPLHVIWK